MMKRFLPFIAVMAMVSLFSCKREDENPYGPEVARGYYPLQKGHYVLYEVDSTIWNDFSGTKEVRHSEVRYTVADTFRDNRNYISYQVNVMSRPLDSGAFVANDVFYVTPTANGVEVVQNNLRFTKLVFPVVNGTAWKGNSYIPAADQDLVWLADWDYKYSQTGASYNNGLADFDNTVIVDETDQHLNDPDTSPGTYAERTYAREVYGYNVGLVYREMVRWTYDQNISGTYARKGWGVIMRAKDHN